MDSIHCVVSYREISSQISPCVTDQQMTTTEEDSEGIGIGNVLMKLETKYMK